MITIKCDVGGIYHAMMEAAEDALATICAEQVLQDANYYCLQDEGTLMASAQTASSPKEGIIAWNTPYAKRRYYGKTALRRVNANARVRWAEEAANSFKDDWAKILQREIGEV